MSDITQSESNPVFDGFKKIELAIDAVKEDIAKNAKGTVSAGVRVRKGLRDVAKMCRTLVKLTIERDKELRAARPKRVKGEKGDEGDSAVEA